jgi:uncharacterized damage-inducible protein DinB
MLEKVAVMKPEVWLRGALPDIPALLQPVAHALLQAGEEVDAIMRDFPGEQLWDRPCGVASVGFHLQHLSGVVDRLFTYARGEMLNEEQTETLAAEEKANAELRAGDLIDTFHRQVEQALEQLRQTDEGSLTEYRSVGRAKLPSTQLGLLVHAAEHTQRHVGQLLVTVRILTNSG